MNVELQHLRMKERRTSDRLAAMQSQPIKAGAEQSPAKMKISEFDPRAGGLLKLLHNSPARPAVRQATGNQVGDAQSYPERQGDNDSQPVSQSEFSLRSVHRS